MTEIAATPRPAAQPRLGWLPAMAGISASRLAIPILALGSTFLYVVNLSVSGYANTYYALAAQAGSQSWTALFFGALDAQGFITIDKPPLSTWLMALSVKALGLSSFAILLPQALLGVATVVVLYLAVRRSFGAGAAFVAGLVMALTPATVLIFRYDNPDALLTFLLVAAAWALGRGLEAGRLRWAVLAAALVGTAFLTKFLQAYVVLPAFALVWLVSTPVSLRRRIAGLVAAGAAVAISSGWWVAIVELLPSSARPYIGGSTTNSVLELILGYDGLGRIFGGRPGGSGLGSAVDGLGATAGVGPGGPSFSGSPGLLRLFNDQFGGQIAWLLPAALLALAVAVVLYRRAPRTDVRVAGTLLWGGWLVTHLAVFSFMSGIIHSYYTVAIAPAIAALAGLGSAELWRRRDSGFLPRAVLGIGLAGTGAVAFVLLDRTPAFAPGLGVAILAISASAGLVLAIPPASIDRRIGGVAAALALVAVLAGPVSYAAATVTSAHSGGDPAAGPVFATGFGGILVGDVDNGTDPTLVSYLVANQGSERWIVAVTGSQSAAAIQLAAGDPVMAMGGFTGGDPAPSLAELQAYVRSGELRYVLVGGPGGGRPGAFGPGAGGPGAGGPGAGGPAGFGSGAGGPGSPGGANDAAARATWVTATCTAVSIPGSSVIGLYDCAGAA